MWFYHFASQSSCNENPSHILHKFDLHFFLSFLSFPLSLPLFLFFSRKSTGIGRLTHHDQMREPRTMHRRRPIKNGLLPASVLVLYQSGDKICSFHYESRATNLICASQDKKCNLGAQSTRHCIHSYVQPLKTHPIDGTRYTVIEWNFDYASVSNMRMNPSHKA